MRWRSRFVRTTNLARGVFGCARLEQQFRDVDMSPLGRQKQRSSEVLCGAARVSKSQSVRGPRGRRTSVGAFTAAFALSS